VKRGWLVALVLIFFLGMLVVAWRYAAPQHSADSEAIDSVNTTIQLRGARDQAQLVRESDGSSRYVIHHFDGTSERLTPQQLADRLYQQAQSRGWVSALFNISSPAGIIWVSLGLLGQLLFTGRMLVQWLVSEKSRRSVVPPLFWWLSLLGATMLLAYFLWRRDLVGVLGQAFGWIIYVRNIHLIYFGHRSVPAAADPAPEPELDEPMLTGMSADARQTR
jgi:lipid-A-disaccharide synthase-like uncharacterized protein